MADKPKASLPPPPGWESAMAAKLQGLLGRIGIGPQADVIDHNQPMGQLGQSRITRTPIYAGRNMGGAAGIYYPGSDEMAIDPAQLRQMGYNSIPHESAHAIFAKGATPFASQLTGSIPASVRWDIEDRPDVYPPKAGDADQGRYDQIMATEGLGHSIGIPWATPYVEKVASKLDPALAAQLLRLHHNAVAVYHLRNAPDATASVVSK